ncbi:YbaK/EbsC family protein [Draconibacterium sp. IB214405]|uniref:aminoacyl-tRNA deacylase n=1 Tax=Draconibacterium sp. IB214405 TaxID=3097352 RepID=UPI002A1488EF|nr:YbaK/EbsC family protein [Draconibacterium sp. IB214405]MDX8339487.1 YbaK/EbsC family protein [Draconibacterium sp. IB214405]
MPVKKLKAFLDENQVKYVVIRHSSAYTSQEIAAKSHVSGKEFAKTVIVKVDGKMAMAVLPASYQVDFDLLKEIFGSSHVDLAKEAEFQRFFPDCEIGAMPPFGNLYDMEVFVAETLAEDEEIAFNAGSHTEMIKMNYADFERLVEPRVFKFSWKMVSMPGDPSERWAYE